MITYATTKEEWFKKNKNNLDWYYNEYRFLKNFILPIDTNVLKNYYIKDSQDRNITPNQAILNNYEFLFTYFCDNYNKDLSEKFVANNWLENILQAVPKGFDKTFSDVGTTFNSFLDSSKYIVFFGILLLLFYFYKEIK
jgi:hypothetical protein